MRLLGASDGAWTARLLGVTGAGTFERGFSTLQLLEDPDDPDRWTTIRARLLDARSQRTRPARDDKVVAAWNGLAVIALAEAGVLLEDERYTEAAVRAATLLADVHLRADPDRLTVVRGQAQVASVDGQVVSVRLDPEDPPACPEAVEAVEAADWVVVGPGSWVTSVMPNLLVPQLRDALERTSARRALVLNLSEQEGETEGLSPTDHLEVLAAHAPDLRLDVVLADHSLVDDAGVLERAAQSLGARVVAADVAVARGADQHDPARLARAFEGFLRAGIQ